MTQEVQELIAQRDELERETFKAVLYSEKHPSEEMARDIKKSNKIINGLTKHILRLTFSNN